MEFVEARGRANLFQLMSESGKRSFAENPLWALALIGVPLFAGLWGGALYIDDAYITFRYAAKIASGAGFVYNSEPVLGTTAPLYCLLLAMLKMVGIPITSSALAIGVLSAGAAPIVLWRIGTRAGMARMGLVAGLCLAFFPHWWLNSKTGMETTFAGMLAVLAVFLYVRRHAAWCGFVCSLLVLTRPDTATLPVLVFVLYLLTDRKRAVRFALAGLPLVVGWTAYAWSVFGSPLPQSLAAKSLIHYFPWQKSLAHYMGWFFAIEEPAGMAFFTGAFLAGAVLIAFRWREALPAALWPPIFIGGLVATEVGPFFWYKVPVLPVMLVPAVYLFYYLGEGLRERWQDATEMKRRLAGAVMVVPLVVTAVQAGLAAPWFTGPERMERYVEKERIFFEMAEEIKMSAADRGIPLSEVTVLAGEVGVLGYALLPARVIDSAGINSAEVYELRKIDWEEYQSAHKGAGWEEMWWGTPEWPAKLIREERPHYIASNIDYLHLRKISAKEWFRDGYSFVRSWKNEVGDVFMLVSRKAGK